MKTRKGKNIACLLTIATLTTSVCAPVYAGAPKPSADESMYVTMDYYGGIEDVGIVKGVALNGQSMIEDYGTYDEIINMTDMSEPVVEGDKVTWQVEDARDGRFYYEVKSEEMKKQIPWDVDVTYKLNGVEIAGEDLAGAEGMVTTLIHVTPKKNIDTYFQNNMALMCGTVVDMKDTLSIEAPGSQLQSMGTEKAVVFMALPGEDAEFRIDIGSNSYESMGVFFMMVPITLGSLDMVNDIRDVRDTVEDSLDAMNAGLDVILDSMEGMKGDLESVKSGVQKAEQAHKTYDSQRETMEANADAAIASVDNIVVYLEVLRTQTEADQDNLDESMNKLVNLGYSLAGLKQYASGATKNLGGLRDSLSGLQQVSSGTISQENIETLQGLIGSSGGASVQDLAANMVAQEASKQTGATVAPTQVTGAVTQIYGARNTFGTDSAKETAEYILANQDTIIATNPTQAAQLIQGATLTKAYLDALSQMGYQYNAEGTPADNAVISGSSTADIGLKSLLSTYLNSLESANASAGELSGTALGNTKDLTELAKAAMEKCEEIMEKTADLSTWTDEVVRDDVQTLITQVNDLISMTELTLSSTQATLKSIRNTMEMTEGTLSSSVSLTLNGMSGILDAGIGMSDGVDTLRNAKNVMKSAIDDELDKIEDNSNVLNMDVNAEFVSFTSAKNPAPSSIQIVMRTKEISIDNAKDNVTDIEIPEEDIGVWGRFVKIFKDLWNSIIGLFQ